MIDLVVAEQGTGRDRRCSNRDGEDNGEMTRYDQDN